MSAARGARVLQGISLALGAALAAWAFADDSFVGGGPGFGSTQAAILALGAGVAASALLPFAWNARVLAVVLSTGFVLGTLELGLQLLFSPRYKAENEFDAQLLYRPIPGVVIESRREPVNGGDRILYRINSQGFRGEELEAAPAARVVVYGDSFTHAYYSSDENTFAARLEGELSERLGRPIEVVNAGVAGYGPDQELLKMERELGELEPDLVIVAIFSGNDFGDLARNKLFRPDGDGAIRANAFTVAPELTREMEVHRRESILKRVLRDGFRGAVARLGLRREEGGEIAAMSPEARLEYFSARHVSEYEEFAVRGDDQVHELAFDSYDADVSLTPKSDSARFKIALMDGVVGRMQEAAERADVPLLLLPIPHPLDLGTHDTGKVDRAKYPDYTPRGLVAILEEIATRRGVPFVDLYSAFAAKGSESLYFKGFDDHWNDAGQAFAAKVVADRLAQVSLLDRLAARAALTGQGER